MAKESAECEGKLGLVKDNCEFLENQSKLRMRMSHQPAIDANRESSSGRAAMFRASFRPRLRRNQAEARARAGSVCTVEEARD